MRNSKRPELEQFISKSQRTAIRTQNTGTQNIVINMSTITIFKKFIAEFLGTLILTYAVLSSITTNNASYLTIVWTHGFSILVLALIFGPVSGGHFNPAVTLAFLLKTDREKRIPVSHLFGYIFSQFLGGFCAGFLNYGMFPKHYRDKTSLQAVTQNNGETLDIGPLAIRDNDNLGYTAMFFHECLGTFYLVLAALLSSQLKNNFIKETVQNLNFTYFSAIFIAMMITYVGLMGHLYYAGINPAREWGPRLAGAVIYGSSAAFTSYCWVPLVGPLVGSVLAAVVYHLITFLYEED